MATPLPAPVLLLGVGNDLRGDDAAGPLVARAVAGWGRAGVRVLERRQLLPELAADVAAATSVVLVDAAVGGPDAVTCEPAQAASGGASTPLTHGPSLSKLLALAHHLEGRSPPAWVVSIPAEQFEFGAAPSAACRAGISAALRLLAALLPR